MERLLTDIAGVLRGQALCLRNVGDLLEEYELQALSAKALFAHQLILEAARELEEDATNRRQGLVAAAPTEVAS